jgi:hypothetical protein
MGQDQVSRAVIGIGLCWHLPLACRGAGPYHTRTLPTLQSAGLSTAEPCAFPELGVPESSQIGLGESIYSNLSTRIYLSIYLSFYFYPSTYLSSII